MCVVSMITDHYRDRWPVVPLLPYPPQPAPYIVPQITITRAQWDEYIELKRKAAEYDARTGQPHCEKPEVPEWEARVLRILEERGLIGKGGQP